MSTEMVIDTHRTPEPCGLEFYSVNELENFLRLNPEYNQETTSVLQSDERTTLLFLIDDYPTRTFKEIFRKDGSLRATFIGPDALEEYINDFFESSPSVFFRQ
jgi:hypothetical protein